MKKIFKAPVIFVDHGSPDRILEDNRINKELGKLGDKLKDNIKGIIVISAHNLSSKVTYISNTEDINIMYDFAGFSQELYNMKYDLKGDLNLSKRLSKDLEGSELTDNIKNDHGTWTILKQLFPEADKKISIITINMNLDSGDYYQIGKKLKKYRDEGYLIITSGNIIHNFDLIDFFEENPQKWAQKFNEDFLKKLVNNDFDDIINYQNLENVNLVFKTKDHYVPIIYAIGAIGKNEKVSILSNEITMGSLSNNLVVFGEY